VVAVVAVAAAALAVVLWPSDDGDGGGGGGGTATTIPATSEPTTVPTTAAPTTEPPTTVTPTTPPPAVDTTTAVFPAAGGARYTDPAAAARAFAVSFVGFTDPVVGSFRQGDARSGEVDVRAAATGPVTTLLVRQLGTDGSWWVLGASTPNITVDTPTAGATIVSPLTTTGRALAWEGAVSVEVRQDGQSAPLGSTVVTGGGDILRPFAGTVTFTRPSTGHGALLYVSQSARDGSVLQATVLRVAFGPS
jgi:hypothetical protein